VPGQKAAGKTVLDASGDFVNQGGILADGPTGSTFSLNIQPSGTGSAAVRGSFINYGTILASAGNTLTINLAANAALFNAGTIIAGGLLEITGSVTGTGAITIAPGATLQIDGSLASTQSIAFASGGAPETLILGSPTGTISNAITGLAGGDRIEFGNGATVTAASVINGNTLAVSYTAAGSAGVYRFTNVTFASPAPVSLWMSYDYVTNDYYVAPTTWLLWTGANGTNFGNPANWSWGTIVPSVANFALFNNSTGGTISGTGSIDGLSFVNTGTWSLARGTSLNARTGLSIGASGGGTNSAGALTIGSGSTVESGGGHILIGASAGDTVSLTIAGGGVLEETAADSPLNYIVYVGTGGASGGLAAASGSVLVTGTGSLLDLPFNGIEIGNSGASGSVTVSNGGSILAATQNSNDTVAVAVGRTGNGTLTVTGAGSQLTAVGEIYVARSETGTLTVGNHGTVLLEPDAAGLAGISIGSGNTVGVGGTGVATVTTGGDLISQGYVQVGVRGTTGDLSVNGGTVQVGSTLYVGQGGTIQNGASYAGNGTLAIGAGGTVELTGGAQTASDGVFLADVNNGQVSTSNAVLSVSGAGALLNTGGNGIGVGLYGAGTLTVSQGGSVAAGSANSGSVAALGIGRQGSGTVMVTGAGSRLTAAGAVYVGRAGSGSLTIANQGAVLVGLDGTGSGGITIGGAGLLNGATLFTGGTGTASVTSGGTLFSTQDVTVGRNGASGSLSVAGGTVEAGTDFVIGASTTLAAEDYDVVGNTVTQAATAKVFNGFGTVTVGAGGLVKIDASGLGTGVAGLVLGSAAGGAGTLSVTSGGSVIAGGGLSIARGSAVSLATGGGIDALGVGVINSGAITGDGLLQALSVTNSGTILASAGGRLELTGPVAGIGTLDIASGATLQLDGSIGAGQSIFFGGPGATLTLGKPSSAALALAGLGAGDRIDLSGVTLTAAAIAGTTLTLKQGTTSYVFTSSASLASDRVQLKPDGGTGTVATLYAEAAPILSGGTVNLGAARIGGALATGSVRLSNGTAASAYQESLIYAVSGATVSNGSGTIASGGTATIGFGLSTATAGTIAGTGTLALTSTGIGTSGLANTALAAQTVALSGTVFAAAKASLGATSLNFGVVHAGAVATQTVGIGNTATGALVDVLTAGSATNSGSITGEVYSFGTAGLAAGTFGTVTISVNTGTAGTLSGTAVLGFRSHDGDLSDIAVNGGTVTVSGTVDNYATAQIVRSGGAGTLTRSGTAYTLNLGSIAQGASAVVADVGVENTAVGPADRLGGSFTVSGTTSFGNSGFAAFSGLGAGAGETSQVVALNTGTAGVFSETITLLGTGSNASGYSGTLAAEVLTVTGTVVAGQTYTLTTTPVTIVAGAGNDTFDATSTALVAGDSLDGGGGVNTLALLGGGTFDLRVPAKLADIQVVTVQETAARTTLDTRSGLNVTVDVVPQGGGSLLINGNTDSGVFNLGAGSDTVVLGSAAESVNGGGGTALVQATAAFAGAAVLGTASGTTTLEITGGGTVSLNAADTHLTVKLDAKTNLTLGTLGFITAVGSTAGGETITAGGANQTLQSIGGNETLVGAASYGDTFLGTASGFTGDVIKTFGGSDEIDITDIAFSTLKPLSFTAAADTLKVSDATHSATLTFTGSYTAASFAAASDGHGGTLIKWV
jgi:T5SS/PEP-CTERM-associated repeat protein